MAVPGTLIYVADAVGVSADCQLINHACDLYDPYDANTPFRCCSDFSSDLQIPKLNPTALNWTTPAGTDNNLFGAEFFDSDLTQPYNNYSYATLPQPQGIDPAALPRSMDAWMLTMTILTGSDPSSDSPLLNVSEIVHSDIGGLALILSCAVQTHNVEDAFVNGRVGPDSVTM